MKYIIIQIVMILLAVLLSYQYGKKQARVEIVEKKVEVVKYVAQKRAKIQAQPHCNRNKLLELMRSGDL